MSDTRPASAARNAPSAARGRAPGIALWVLQVLLALQFLAAGFLRVGGNPAMVEMFSATGLWFRYLVGTLEIAGAVGVLIPRLSGLAAFGLVCLMAGAALTNAVVLGTSPLPPSSRSWLAPWWPGVSGSGPGHFSGDRAVEAPPRRSVEGCVQAHRTVGGHPRKERTVWRMTETPKTQGPTSSHRNRLRTSRPSTGSSAPGSSPGTRGGR